MGGGGRRLKTASDGDIYWLGAFYEMQEAGVNTSETREMSREWVEGECCVDGKEDISSKFASLREWLAMRRSLSD